MSWGRGVVGAWSQVRHARLEAECKTVYSTAATICHVQDVGATCCPHVQGSRHGDCVAVGSWGNFDILGVGHMA